MKSAVVLLLCVSPFSQSKFGCATPKAFQEQNPGLKNDESEKIFLTEKIYLPLLLFEKAKSNDKNNTRPEKSIEWQNKKFTIKKLVANPNKEMDTKVSNKIRSVKKMCGKDPDIVYNELFECHSDIIVGFKGAWKLKTFCMSLRSQ